LFAHVSRPYLNDKKNVQNNKKRSTPQKDSKYDKSPINLKMKKWKMKRKKKKNTFLALVFGELFSIMLSKKMDFALTKTKLSVFSIERMNPLECT
jgi:hypothetical protein